LHAQQRGQQQPVVLGVRLTCHRGSGRAAVSQSFDHEDGGAGSVDAPLTAAAARLCQRGVDRAAGARAAAKNR
jgi:hypothetical protein